MKRIAAPMIGGIVTSFILELVIYPVIFEMWKGRGLNRHISKPETEIRPA
jgi:Cu(I)/Ag(I) efflux system membrane protein CusA/SilA